MAFMAPFMTGLTAGAGAGLGAFSSGAAVAGMAGAGSTALGTGLMVGSVAPTVLSLASPVMSIMGAKQQADAQEMVAKANQQQLEARAKEETAVSQRQALAERRKTELMMSRAMAVAAASGAGTSGIEGILAGIAKEGEEQVQFRTYEGEEAAKGLRYRGQLGVAEARERARSTLMGGVTSAATSLFGRYGAGLFQGAA